MSTLSSASILQLIIHKLTYQRMLFSAGHLFAQEDDTIRVQRRRRAGPDSSGERERAEAPNRERPAATPPRGTGGGGNSGSGGNAGGGNSGGSSGSGRPRPSGGGGSGCAIPGGGVGLLVILAIIVIFFFFRGGDTPSNDANVAVVNTPIVTPTTATQSRPTPTPRPNIAASSSNSSTNTDSRGDTWTVMIYADADDKVLEHDIYVDLNEAERVGSSDKVNIVAQLDRYQGGYNGDGNWTSAKRFYVTHDDDLQRVGSQVIADLGEVNMADAATLVDFVTWAIEAYPADKYALIMSDHGMGWPGGWSDPTAGGSTDRSSPLASRLDDLLYLHEIDAALQEIREKTGVEKLELIGMDACLMAHIEVFSALEPHARYAVASQETEPALGWAYTSFLGALVANPAMNGAELSQHILNSYIKDDQRIVDDQARAELVGRGQPTGGLFEILLGSSGAPSAQQVAQQMGKDITLSAVDLGALPALISSLNTFADALQSADQRDVAKARTYAQSFTNVFDSRSQAPYIDLVHFAQLSEQTSSTGALRQATDALMTALDQAVIGEIHGAGLPGATGISIYFPISQLYKTPEAGPRSYTVIANRFAQNSVWDEYLNFHYTGRPFTLESNVPATTESAAIEQGPAAGGISASPITASANVASPGNPVLLSTHIEGLNVGYVYFFAGYIDVDARSLLTVDMDYLESDETGELKGVYYPIWPEDGSFEMEFEWEPIVFAISDGTNRVPTLFQPHSYGEQPEDAIYTVEGTYTYVDGESRPARLYFRYGVLQQVFGFSGGSTGNVPTGDAPTVGAPREIIPQAGDRFTVQERWSDLDNQGRVVGEVVEQGETLTFGDRPFTWVEMDAAAGSYVVGFIVEDLDGNRSHVYTQIDVQ